MVTPDNIEKLEPGQIFVFGSNFLGHHSGGAAKLAFEKFGAKWGIGEGLQGRSYAFPTLNSEMENRTDNELKESVKRLYWCIELHPCLTFFLTRVGCGIASFNESYMIELFQDSPPNLVKPERW